MNALVGDMADRGLLGALALAVLVAVGSLVPVLPTGTLVSAATVLATASNVPARALGALFVAASVGALVGDVGLQAISFRAGGSVLGWLERRSDGRLRARAEERLQAHTVQVLIVSRLLPAGRIPVALAAVSTELPWRRFLSGGAVAALVWSAVYMALGAAGAAGFEDEPVLGVLTSVVVVMVFSAVVGLWQRRRRKSSSTAEGVT